MISLIFPQISRKLITKIQFYRTARAESTLKYLIKIHIDLSVHLKATAALIEMNNIIHTVQSESSNLYICITFFLTRCSPKTPSHIPI